MRFVFWPLLLTEGHSPAQEDPVPHSWDLATPSQGHRSREVVVGSFLPTAAWRTQSRWAGTHPLHFGQRWKCQGTSRDMQYTKPTERNKVATLRVTTRGPQAPHVSPKQGDSLQKKIKWNQDAPNAQNLNHTSYQETGALQLEWEKIINWP